jgi:hypothetical protein
MAAVAAAAAYQAEHARQVVLRARPAAAACVHLVRLLAWWELSARSLKDGLRHVLEAPLLPEGRLPEGRLPEGRLPEGRLAGARLTGARLPEEHPLAACLPSFLFAVCLAAGVCPAVAWQTLEASVEEQPPLEVAALQVEQLAAVPNRKRQNHVSPSAMCMPLV